MLLTHTPYSRAVPVRSVYRSSPRLGPPFHWLEAGWENTETVVLLHGLMAHAMAYRCVVEALATRYRVIMPDLPGHGRDATFRADAMAPSVPSLQLWLECLFELLDSERVHLVGHSLGATLSFLAAREASRFAKMETVTLVSPGLQIAVPRWTPHLVKRIPSRLARLGTNSLGLRIYEPLQWRRARMNTAELAAYLEPIRDIDRLTYIMALGADLVSTPDRLQGAEQIELPTLIVWGDRDHLLPVTTAHRLHRTIPHSQLAIFGNCGHCPMEDCPVDFTQTLTGFLSN